MAMAPSRRDDVLRWALELTPRIPAEMEFVMLGTTPRVEDTVVDGPPQLIVSASVMYGTDDESREALRLLQTCPVFDRRLGGEEFQPKTLDELYSLGDSTEPPGFRWAVDNMWTDAGSDALIPEIRELFLDVPTPASHIFWMHWRDQEIPNAALSVTGNVYIAAFTGWTDPADDEKYRFWGRDHMRRLEPLSKGIQLADENLRGRPEARYLSDENDARLEELRAKWDPDGVVCGYLKG